jgi:hypothetical protein
MPATTKIAGGYRLRLALIAAMCLFWTAWSLYDGLVAYPAQNDHAEVHDYIFGNTDKSELPRDKKRDLWLAFAEPRNLPEGDPQQDDFTEDQKYELWREYAVVHGLATDTEPQRHSPSSIFTQFIMAGITAPIGLVFAFSYVTSFGRWIRTDEDGIATSAGQEATYGQVTGLDKERWKTKGIAIVHYEHPKGQGKIVLDDWKFDRPTTDIIVRDLEQHLPDDRIVNGEREPDYEALARDDEARL